MRTILFFVFFVSFASSAEQTFYLNCKVLDQNIFEIKEGKSKKFIGHKNGIKKGETFSIKFQYFPYDKKLPETTFAFWLTIPGWIRYCDHPACDDVILMESDHGSPTYTLEGSLSGDISFSRKYFGQLDLYLANDSISVRSINHTFFLSRYYKNDWQLLFNFHDDGLQTYTGTANCMGMPNTYNEVLESMHKKYQ